MDTYTVRAYVTIMLQAQDETSAKEEVEDQLANLAESWEIESISN